MSKSDYVISMIHSFVRNDREGFNEICTDLIKYEEKKGNYKIALKMRDALENKSFYSEPSIVSSGFTVEPLESISSFEKTNKNNEKVKDLLDIRSPKADFENLILDVETTDELKSIIEQWKYKDNLLPYNLAPQSKILFHGPPGTGKTYASHIIGSELNLEIAYVNFDVLISSYLGQTGENVGEIFKYISSKKSILLLDELDAIGKKRDDNQELGELKRIVISLLQNLDNLKGDSMIIACTNHAHLLDSALWRRFDNTIEFKLPEKPERGRIITQTLQARNIALPRYRMQIIEKLSGGMSPSDLIRCINNGVRRWVFQNNKREVHLNIIEELLRYSNIDNMQPREKIQIAQILRENGNGYSLQYLSEILSIPKSTLHKKLKEGQYGEE
ncbi:AAA family ATPase [Priestia megaterium]